MIAEQKGAMAEAHDRKVRVGVILCILSVVPVILLAAMADGNDFAAGLGVGLMFGLVAFAVKLFVEAGYLKGTMERLLQKGEFRPEIKRKSDFGKIYWAMITAAYLAYSFITQDWHISWIMWVLAGIAYPFVIGVKPKSE